ncbi:MAG: FG-GAP repeat domain-containing protein [Promethearchaeota archaeon]
MVGLLLKTLKRFKGDKRGLNEIFSAILVIALAVSGAAVGALVVLPMITRASYESRVIMVQDQLKDLNDAIEALLTDERGSQQHLGAPSLTVPITYDDGDQVVVGFYDYDSDTDTYTPLSGSGSQIPLQLGRVSVKLSDYTQTVPEGGVLYLNGPEPELERPIAFFWDMGSQGTSYVGFDNSRVDHPLGESSYFLNLDYRVRVQLGELSEETIEITKDMAYAKPVVTPNGDLVVGYEDGTIYRFKNKNTDTLTFDDGVKILFEHSHPYAAPEVVDWNSDGKLDLLVGDSSGYVTYYENTGTNDKPRYANGEYLQVWWKIEFKGELIDEGPTDLRVNDYHYSVPTAADVDNDGDIDLLVGYGSEPTKSKQVYFFENRADPDEESKEPKLYKTLIDFFGIFEFTLDDNYIVTPGCFLGRKFKSKGHTTVSTYDIDAENGPDIIVGDKNGNIYVLNNTGEETFFFNRPIFEPCQAYYHGGDGNLAKTFKLDSIFKSIYGYNLAYTAPLFKDLTGDGILDLVFGEQGGGIFLMEGIDPENGHFYPIDFNNPVPLLPPIKEVVETGKMNVEILIETVLLRTTSPTNTLESSDILIELSEIEIQEYQFTDDISTLAIRVAINDGHEELLPDYRATPNIGNLTVKVIKRIMNLS